jgi:hypothetical protein
MVKDIGRGGVIKVVQDRFQLQGLCEEGYGHSCPVSGGDVDDLSGHHLLKQNSAP